MQSRKLQDSKKPDMGNDLKQLMQYIKDHPIQFGDSFDSPSLAGLYWLYSESHKMSELHSRRASDWGAADDGINGGADGINISASRTYPRGYRIESCLRNQKQNLI